ncbi:MAG: hypothetical protein AB7O68_00620 [Pirellulales bacterium]
MRIKLQVYELESDWLLIVFQGSKPPVEKRAFWLNRSLTDWLGAHPGRTITGTLLVMHHGELLAIHVWLDAPARAADQQVQLKVRHSLLGSLPKEHLEALLQEAYRIFFERSEVPVLTVVNRRGIAVLMDRAAEEAHVLPLEELGIDDTPKEAIRRWLAAPTSKYSLIESAKRSVRG